MRLILTQQVSGLGDPGDIVEVKDGYGRNFLLPRQLAIAATRGAEKQVAAIRRAREVRGIRELSEAREIASALEALRIQLPVRAGQGGRLFGSVSTADIAAAVRAAGGPQLDRRRIELDEPIKTVGTHVARVRLHQEASATLAVEVVAVD